MLKFFQRIKKYNNINILTVIELFSWSNLVSFIKYASYFQIPRFTQRADNWFQGKAKLS